MASTTKLTEEYISKNPSIKDCLKKGLINYSQLSRLIAKELDIKKTSNEAILIASRRFKEKLMKEEDYQLKIIDLLKKSQLDIKNKIIVAIIDKYIYPDKLIELEKQVKKNRDIFFAIEGTDAITLVTSEKYLPEIKKSFKSSIIKITENLAMIIIKSPKELETTTGVTAYLYSKFGANGVNIYETMSCWTDNIFVVDEKDIAKCMGFLRF